MRTTMSTTHYDLTSCKNKTWENYTAARRTMSRQSHFSQVLPNLVHLLGAIQNRGIHDKVAHLFLVMLHCSQRSLERNGDLRLTDQCSRVALVIQSSGGIGVDQHDLVFECSCHTQSIHKLDLGVFVVLHTLAGIFKAPVAWADHHLHAFSHHCPENLRKDQIPTDNQPNFAKARLKNAAFSAGSIIGSFGYP